MVSSVTSKVQKNVPHLTDFGSAYFRLRGGLNFSPLGVEANSFFFSVLKVNP
jgi:hypothetical protein